MFKKYKLLIPTLVLVVTVAWTFINSGIDYSLTTQHYCGLAASVICAISFFAFRPYYKYILGATLLLGLINVFNFTSSQVAISFKLNSVGIGFQPYAFYVTILTLILAIPKKSEVNVIQSEGLSKLSEDQFKEDLERFRKLFATKPSADLSEIIEGSKFTPAAKEAAIQLLNERQEENGRAN